MMEHCMRYAVVIEKGQNNYSAYVPDLPGCVAVGDTIEETQREIQGAIEFHLEGLRADGLPVPEPSSRVEYVEVTA
jgi:predicted RNase H-like HicB family nuclease